MSTPEEAISQEASLSFPLVRATPKEQPTTFRELIVFSVEDKKHINALKLIDRETTQTNVYDDGFKPKKGDYMSRADIKRWILEYKDTLRGIVDSEGTIVGFLDLSTIDPQTLETLGVEGEAKELSIGRRHNVPDLVLAGAIQEYIVQMQSGAIPSTDQLVFFANTGNSAEYNDFAATLLAKFTHLAPQVDYEGDGVMHDASALLVRR